MILGEALRTATRALLGNKVRSFLTMLGVVIGVASITSLLGLGQGLKQDITRQVTALGTNLVIVLPGQVRTQGGGFNPAASVGASTLTEADLEALRTSPEVTTVTPLSLLAGLPTAGERSAPGALTLAVEPSYFQVFTTAKLRAGRRLTPDDEAVQARVAVLDRGPRQALFPQLGPDQVIGQRLNFAGQTFTVVGVVETPESASMFGGTSFSTGLFIPYATARATIQNTQIFRIALQADPDVDVRAFAGRVADRLRELHRGVEDFTVLTQEDILRVIDDIISLLTTAVTGIGAIALLVGGIGIMNIMLVSVTERTKEIGIRKALGASSGNVLLQFLLEAVFLSVLGGLIGLGLAFVASFPVQAKLGLTLLVNPLTIGLAFGFSVLVGVVFGVAPAARASRLNPVDALRYD